MIDSRYTDCTTVYPRGMLRNRFFVVDDSSHAPRSSRLDSHIKRSLIIKFDKSEGAILLFAQAICKLFAHQTWAICGGISTQFREEFFYVFRQMDLTSAQICGLLLPDCADPNDPTQSGWQVQIPPRPKTLRPPVKPTKTDSIRVLQLSDLHVDFDYKAGSEARCDEPICCHTETATPALPAGYWGTVAACDIPHRTLENMLDHINRTLWVDYVLLSGDFVNHADWDYTVEEHLHVLHNLSSLIAKYFPDTPTYWALGNHEGVPVNNFAPHFAPAKFIPTWLYQAFLNISAPWMDAENNSTAMYRGSYSTVLTKGLRLISVNTGFCETTNFFLYLNQSDPDGTMSWFVAELLKAEQAGEKVHILGHIPPGDGECLEGWARNYYKVIQRFNDTIQAQFFGHVHWDYFTVFYEDMHNVASDPVGVLYATPSATTFEGLNPAFRIYTVDPEKGFAVTNFDTFSTDLSKANQTHPPVWTKLYSALTQYNLTDLSPKSWNGVIKQIFEEKEVHDDFFRLATRTDPTTCNAECQNTLKCSLRSGHHNQTLYCPPSAIKSHLKTNMVPQK
ncbi:unnamed protein product, partial [Mesorhabditis spiculigera]